MKKIIVPALTCMAVFAFQYAATAAPIGPGYLPARITSAFSSRYPTAEMNNWARRTNDYVINFITNKERSADAYYFLDGTWLRTDTRLSRISDLPEAVRDGLARSSYGKYFIDKMEKVQLPFHRTLYIVGVDYGGYIDWDLFDTHSFSNKYVLYFTPDGRLQKAVHTPDEMPTEPFAGD
ncbi:MAG TPA: hypothetical protein VL978_06915 [Puia sp.]|nr:hypothetical protein [Puia sp.]